MRSEYIVSGHVPEVPGVYEGRSIENPNLPLTDAAIWGEYGLTSVSDAGVAVNSSTALTYAPVWQAVNLISGDVAKLPLNPYRRRADLGDGGRELDRGHVSYQLVRKRANRQMHAFHFWRRLMVHALIWNHGFAVIERDLNGTPLAMYPLLPDRTQAEVQDDGSTIYASEVGGKLMGFFPSEIFHIRGIEVTGRADCRLVHKARDSWALGLAAQKMTAKFFSNGGRTGGILEIPTSYSKKASDNLEGGFRKAYETLDAAFKTVLLRDGAKFHESQKTAQEMQALEMRAEQVREVARFYNLPPHKLGESSGATVSYNSLEQLQQDYLDTTLDHWLCTIAAEAEMKLLTESEHTSDSHYFEHNTAALLRTDLAARMEAYEKGIGMGILNPDEARAKENMNPRPDGLGNRYRFSQNFVVDGSQPTEGDDGSRQAILEANLAVLRESVTRSLQATLAAVKRKSKTTKTRFAKWINEGLTGECKPKFEERIASACAAIGACLSVPGEEIAGRIAGELFNALQRDLTAAVNDHTAQLIQMATADICDVHERHAGKVLANIIQQEGQDNADN